MVAVGSESPLDLHALLTTLESKTSSTNERLEAYNVLTKQLVDGELSIYERDIQQQGLRLLKVAKRDVTASGGTQDMVAQKALSVMTYCLQDTETVRFVAAGELSVIINLLCQVATSTSERAVCSSALTCLARQVIASDVIAAELQQILTALGTAKSKWKTDVEQELLAVIIRLCQQCEKQMTTDCRVWGRLVLSQIASSSPKVRERAFDCASKYTTVFSSNAELAKAVATDVTSFLKTNLLEIFHGHEQYVLKAWELLVKVLAKELLHSTLLNAMFKVIKCAFCAASQEVRTQAFFSWHLFIDIMADVPNWFGDPKYLQLVMSVFSTHNTRTEESNMAKLKAWWHLIRCLGTRVWNNFDLVIKPLLNFCLGNVRVGSKSSTVPGTPTTPRIAGRDLKSPATPKMNVSSLGDTVLQSVKIQLLGFEILAHLLGDATKSTCLSQVPFSLEPLKTEVSVSVTSFIKNSGVLITVMFESFKLLGTKIPEPLLLYVWQSMISRLNAIFESSTRSERREPLSAFLGQFQVLVLSSVLPHKLVLKLFQIVCSLPQRVLSSTAFSVKGQDVKGSPAQFLCEVLLTPPLLKECSNNESFMTVLSMLLQCGSTHPAGVLEFCQHVVNLLDRNAQFLPGPEAQWRLWSIMAHTLQDHISKTNEVNQGDSLEYNFNCMYATLMLPISHHLGAIVRQPVCKTLMKTWSELYRTFARLSALVTNAEANIIVETISRRILEVLQKENCLKDGAMLEYVMSICHEIVDTIDFSSLSPAQTFALGLSVSPSKWSRRRSKPMGNIHSFVCLVAMVMEGIVEGVEHEGEEPPVFAKQRPSESAAHLNVAAITSIDVTTVLVTHVTVSSIIGQMLEKLAPPLAGLMTAGTKKTAVKLHTLASLQKLEKLWLDVCTMIQSRYTGPYDSDLLASLSPLLKATFLHPRRQIKNQTVLLWNATFSRSAPLTYPSELQPVLMKVKEKTQIMLPGWTNVDMAVIEETPYSQMSQPDSLAPEPVIPGMPSPTRIKGSFLHKDVSPNPKAAAVSPRRVNPSEHRPFGESARKKLSVDFMPKEEFVVITNTPKKRRVLTEHQKEVLKEKRVIPAMYNNLDASQDVSLMSQLSCSDTQQDTLPTPPGTADCVIMVNSSQSQDQQKQDQALVEKPPATSSSSESPPEQAPVSTPRRSSRRKSVHFEETSNSLPASKESDNSCSDGRPWKLNTGGSSSSENGGAAPVFVIPSSKSSSDDNLEKSPEDKKTPSLPLPEPNMMATMGDKLVESLGSKEISSSSSGKGSSGEEKKDEESDENDPFFRPFKSFSQSPPMTRSHLSEKSMPQNSVRMLTRKTRSQEIVGSVKSSVKVSPSKKSGDQPFTSLEKWLRKTPAVPDVPPTKIFSKSPEVIANSPPLPQTTSMLVEDTQSPKKLAAAQKTNVSILETPPKVSVPVSPLSIQLSREASLTGDGGSSVGEKGLKVTEGVSALLKKPVLQLERLPDADPAKRVLVACPPSPMETDEAGDVKQGEQQLDSKLDPSVLMDEAASHGMSPEITAPAISMLVTPTNRSVDESSPSSSSQQDKAHDHKNLFGFSDLLDADSKDAENAGQEIDSRNAGEKDVVSESMSTHTEEGMSEKPRVDDEECGQYDPGLQPTLQTPPRRIALRSLDRDCSTSSSQSQKSSQSSDSQAPSSQPDDDVSDFDPMKESTLADVGDHAKRRKQRTPKKIKFPEKLRRTPRRKKQRKSLCSCCKDGPSFHHGKTHKSTSSDQGSSDDQKGDNVVSQKEQLSGKTDKETAGTDVEPLVQTTGQSLENMETTGETDVEDANAKLAPSPQDLGEKTPELKSTSTITPRRKSTTKTKMQAARRRSISKSFDKCAERGGTSDSDSDDVPLSQLTQGATNMTNIVEKDGESKEREESASVSKVSPQAGTAAKTHTQSASKRKLKKLSRQRPGQGLRSPPKLRLRQRKEEWSKEKTAAELGKTEQTKVDTPTKSLAAIEEPRHEDVAAKAGFAPDTDAACGRAVSDNDSLRLGMSKSTGKKVGRKGLAKRLTPSPGRRHLQSAGNRSRTRSHGRLTSLPLRSGSHRKLFRTSPAHTRQLRRRTIESFAPQEVADEPEEDNLGDELAVEKQDGSPLSANAPSVPNEAPDKVVTTVVQDEAQELMDTEQKPCLEATGMKLSTEIESVVSDGAEQEAADQVLPSGVGITDSLESEDPTTSRQPTEKETASDIVEKDMSEMDVDVKKPGNDDVDSGAESDTSFHSFDSSPKADEASNIIPTEEKEKEETQKVSKNSEDMFDSIGFIPDEVSNSEKGLQAPYSETSGDIAAASHSMEPSAALFSQSGQQLSLYECAQQPVSPQESHSQESLVSIPTFGSCDMFKDADAPAEKEALEAEPQENADKESGDGLPVSSAPDLSGDSSDVSRNDAAASLMTGGGTNRQVDAESSGTDTLFEQGTQTDLPLSEEQEPASCKICGSCIQKINSEDGEQSTKAALMDASTQTESSKAGDILDAADGNEAEEVAEEGASRTFVMITKDSATKITPMKSKRVERDGGFQVPSSPLSGAASDSKIVRVQQLHQRFRIQHSDRGLSMVRRSLLQRQLRRQLDGYEEQGANVGKDEQGKSSSAEGSSSMPPPSPAGSQSNGILKKRQFQDSASAEGSATQGESPTPSKKRRVSFAEPVVSGESPSHEATLNKIPWGWESPSKKGSKCVPFLSSPSPGLSFRKVKRKCKMRREILMLDDSEASTSGQSSQTQSETSQNSYHSTQESQLNATDPIFPPLVDCDIPVERILPELTSSAWSRGLTQMLAANGIITISGLARRTEVEIQSLPFRAPKVPVVRRALQHFYRQYFPKASARLAAESAAAAAAAGNGNKNSATDDKNERLPSAEEALRQLSPIKGTSANKDIEDGDAFENEDNPGTSQPMEDLDDEVNMAPQSPSCSKPGSDPLPAMRQEQTCLSDHSQTVSQGEVSLLEKIVSLAEDDNMDELMQMKKEDLSQIHKLLSFLTNKVVGALINRCPSPPQ